jgi:hypothetical protein
MNKWPSIYYAKLIFHNKIVKWIKCIVTITPLLTFRSSLCLFLLSSTNACVWFWYSQLSHKFIPQCHPFQFLASQWLTWYTSEYVRICQNMSEYVRICQNMLEYMIIIIIHHPSSIIIHLNTEEYIGHCSFIAWNFMSNNSTMKSWGEFEKQIPGYSE